MKRSQKLQQDRMVREKFESERRLPALTPKTDNQKHFLEGLEEKTLSIGAGVAGSGKTLLSCWYATKELVNHRTNKIVLIRAYQPLAGRNMGFLPGTVEDKLLPYYQQMLCYIEDFMGKASLEVALKRKDIEICALEAIRGRSWDDSIVIVDEAQNLYVPEIQALMTRIGQGTKMILIGDNTGIQTDVRKGQNGLDYLIDIVRKYNIQDHQKTFFGYDDILRSGITKDFVIAFDREERNAKSN